MNDITEPLRLAVGSHSAGSGKGCAMNLISWENGDTTITDLPGCSDPMLARIVQRINDSICTHRDGDLLCPACSLIVLELAHRTVGTGTLTLTDQERRVIWVKIAIDQARQVQHLVPARHKTQADNALTAAENWAQNPSDRTATATAAAYAAAYAATAAAYAYADAAYAADAVGAVRETGARLSLTYRAFDLFEELTQHVQPVISDHQVAEAYACMTTATHH